MSKASVNHRLYAMHLRFHSCRPRQWLLMTWKPHVARKKCVIPSGQWWLQVEMVAKSYAKCLFLIAVVTGGCASPIGCMEDLHLSANRRQLLTLSKPKVKAASTETRWFNTESDCYDFIALHTPPQKRFRVTVWCCHV